MAQFSDLLKAEGAYIRRRSAAPDPGADAGPWPGARLGVALSGGGIRSATFALGVLQSLAKHEILRSVDYLSSVSGGGYAAAWLTAWIRRSESVLIVEEKLKSPPNPNSPGVSAEPLELKNLRALSNYLTPNLDVLGSDPWTFIAMYGINLFNTVITIYSLVSAVLFVPLLELHYISRLTTSTPVFWVVLVFLTSIFVSALLWGLDRRLTAPAASHRYDFIAELSLLTSYYLIWILVCSRIPIAPDDFAFNNLSRVSIKSWFSSQPSQGSLILSTLIVSIFVLLGYKTVLRVLTWVELKIFWSRTVLHVLGVAASMLIFGFLIVPAFLRLFVRVLRIELTPEVLALLCGPYIGCAVLLILFAIVAASVPKAAPATAVREWLAYLLGRYVLAVLLGSALCVASLIAPYVWYKQKNIEIFIGVAAVACIFFVRQIAIRVAEDGDRSRWGRLGLNGALLITLCAVLTVISGLNYNLAAPDGSSPYWTTLKDFYAGPVGSYFAVAVALLLWISYRVGNNSFSMNSFYRNRLVRCYLHASTMSSIDPASIVDFDPNDDILLSDICGPEYDGPYPLFNSTLSVFAGQELAWQERRGVSCCLSPRYCGFEAREGISGPQFNNGAYIETKDFLSIWEEPVSLGQAMAISGAAVNPYMGNQSSRPAIFLLALLNMRLGQWVPNPWISDARLFDRNRLITLLREIGGQTDDTSDYVYLTDGGYFDNTGIYELVKRRVKVILAFDGTCDPECNCDALANAIEKCRVDLGIAIQIKIPFSKESRSENAWAVGTIKYRSAGYGDDGLLIFVKATLTGREPLDVQRYARRRPNFPHESTTKQWFSESQFESYRELGELTCDDMIAENRGRLGVPIAPR
ncbi:MAG TPA: patatin-like phospholipase family protein [Bryobacteraceae bacterium]